MNGGGGGFHDSIMNTLFNYICLHIIVAVVVINDDNMIWMLGIVILTRF